MYCYVHISEANQLLEVIFSPVRRFYTGLSIFDANLEVIFSPVKRFYTGLLIFDANLAKSAYLEDWTPRRLSGL